ncbi:MAG: hypothetical protein ACYCXA_07485 [Actinomycetes bacterium]
MDLKKNLGRKLAALGIAGGTAFALFGGSAVQTTFSATTGGTATFSGARVTSAEFVDGTSGGSFTCSGLLPGGPTCIQTIKLTNTGNVTEDFAATINAPSGTLSALANLQQLQVDYNYTMSGGDSAWNAHLPSTLSPGTSFDLGSLKAGDSATVTLTFSLESEQSGWSTAQANAWNNAIVQIPYTVTATAGH